MGGRRRAHQCGVAGAFLERADRADLRRRAEEGGARVPGADAPHWRSGARPCRLGRVLPLSRRDLHDRAEHHRRRRPARLGSVALGRAAADRVEVMDFPRPDPERARLYHAAGQWRRETIAQLIAATTAAMPDKVAVRDASGAALSYRALAEQSDRLAGFLAARGLV